jgi:hypothetical protein
MREVRSNGPTADWPKAFLASEAHATTHCALESDEAVLAQRLELCPESLCESLVGGSGERALAYSRPRPSRSIKESNPIGSAMLDDEAGGTIRADMHGHFSSN